MGKIGRYLQEAYDELLHKVTWPNWNTLQQMTIVVIIGMAITTLVILAMDQVSELVLKFIYGLAA